MDRLTITLLHMAHGNDAVKAESIALTQEIEAEYPMVAAFAALMLTNMGIWMLESDIRKGKEGEMTLEEVGLRALKIRDLNKVRVDTKANIAKATGGFTHVKTDHASA